MVSACLPNLSQSALVTGQIQTDTDLTLVSSPHSQASVLRRMLSVISTIFLLNKLPGLLVFVIYNALCQSAGIYNEN